MPTLGYFTALGYSNPGDPGSFQEREWKKKNLKKAMAVPVVKTLWVHKSVVVQFNALNLVLQKMGAKLGETVDDWGFANRDIRGFVGSKSYHAIGLAEDLDATENPMGVRKTTFPVEKTRKACKLLGLKWGYDYEGRPDPMHFESSVSRLRARYIRSRLVKPTRRSKRLAAMADIPVHTFCARVQAFDDYPQ